MARNPLAHACLLATILVAGAMPTEADLSEPGPGLPDTDVTDEVTGYSPSCSKSDDDAGTGGTQVSCKYSCSANNLLAIGGSATDPDARAYGNTSCGGTSAICRTVQNTCEGASEGMTTQAQSKATCYGGSDEFWSSPMTIACASHGTDPEAIICRLVRDLCNLDDPGLPPVDDPLVDDRELPPVKEPEVSLDLEELCLEVASEAEGAVTFVLAYVDLTLFEVVTFDPAQGCQVSTGAF